MPIYEYKCQTCSAQFELMQKFSDPLATHCSVCGAEGVKKLVSNTSFQLKGSGWYVTDYGKGNSGNKSNGSAEGKAGDSKSGDSKAGDSKAGDSKAGDSKSGDSKSGDSKSGDSKSSDSKSSD